MDLMDLLPDIYDDNATMIELQGVLSAKINAIASDFNETIDQCFVSTATDLISRYEKIYGLSVDVSKSDTFRRERIIARARGIGTVTAKMLEEVATSFSNGEVEVIEYLGEYRFVVKFVGTKGVPPNMADLTLTIEEIKPAHLTYVFEYTYLTWDEFERYNNVWDEWDLLGLTWNEFETYKGGA